MLYIYNIKGPELVGMLQLCFISIPRNDIYMKLCGKILENRPNTRLVQKLVFFSGGHQRFLGPVFVAL